MCGRVFQTLDLKQLLRIAGTFLVKNSEAYAPSYNIAPTEYVPVIRHTDSPQDNNRILDIMKWGYEPFQKLLFNARAENPHKKKTFSPLINTRRCVVILEGYYQWNSEKEPHVFRPKKNGQPQKDDMPVHLLVAGLYAHDGSVILLTRESFGDASQVHHSMPVILDQSEIDMWINSDKYKYEAIQAEILNEQKEKWKLMFFYKLAPYVNDSRNKSEKVLTKAEEFNNGPDKSGIKRFFNSVSKGKPNEETKFHLANDAEEDEDGEEIAEQKEKKVDDYKDKPEEINDLNKQDEEPKMKEKNIAKNGKEKEFGEIIIKDKELLNGSVNETVEESEAASATDKESKGIKKKATEDPYELSKTLTQIKDVLEEAGFDVGKRIKVRKAIVILEKSDDEDGSDNKENETNNVKGKESIGKDSKSKEGDLKKRYSYQGRDDENHMPNPKRTKRGPQTPFLLRR